MEKKELVATCVQIMTEALFKHHFYTFGNHIYHQREGGPIGLRGTCAVARVTMQMWDISWKKRLQEENITTWLLARYMDDARAFLPPFRPGWRWVKDGLRFCQLWVKEDRNLTPTELTKRVLAGSMEGVEHFLNFTYETFEQF